MIVGTVDGHGHLFVEVAVSGRRGGVVVTALLDTGFDGEICLPIEVAVTLGLELVDVGSVELADGTVRDDLIFEGQVVWDGQVRPVAISLTASDEPTIGTGLLLDRIFMVNFADRTLRIDPVH